MADPRWSDPLDPTYAMEAGGRWNPPGSFDTLYLNANVRTARAQIERMLEGTSGDIDDLVDDAYVLIKASIPRNQTVADAGSSGGLTALHLPPTYPLASGVVFAHAPCTLVGQKVRRAGLRGVWCRSAATADGSGRELAWFPASRRSRAQPIDEPLPLGEWRHATGWGDLKLPDQADPKGA